MLHSHKNIGKIIGQFCLGKGLSSEEQRRDVNLSLNPITVKSLISGLLLAEILY